MTEKLITEKKLFACGHTACAGCGQSLGARLVLEAAGPNTIVTNATGCLEVFSTRYPESSWGVPWLHSLFENSAAIASGVESALKHLGKIDTIRVISQGGDGGTADIGLQALSGMMERGHDILYVCYDNEAYMNTGIQRSGLTPFDTNTTTSPAGKISSGNPLPKKNMVEICAAHRIPYAASSSVGFPLDVQSKVKKALSIRGPKYLHLHVPCPLGWRHPSNLTINIAKLAVETALFPMVEYEYGKLVSSRKLVTIKPVEEYLKPQGRFAHLFKDEKGKQEIAKIQQIANQNIEYYNLKATK
ncbi:MAG: pyruvate ferredoxin oxidoreductase [Candidatus Omnitrophica bacterium CG07_land_8_20_14_0_80_42_15]|uniref:Pyruvate ferredoxin oxidoreductase n=1 Tax=Candidatus Aquitaenariimonas noxiae TaxID=1974741 RepID=A0A2J0KRL6_9BACT|nr:MAG: pyruvate ferredoxin oxidoreductase [Candidatus Omnitrophica bacterium CG07_land_8_20_14_0_80_42_15]